ncbi:MAG: hypothetical protein WA633_17845, partial [Stellaceae bacterium]
QRLEAEALLKKARLSSAYADLTKARHNFIAHWNRGKMQGYTSPEEVFPHLTLDDFGKLLRCVQDIGRIAIGQDMEESIPGFEGVNRLLRAVRPALDA